MNQLQKQVIGLQKKSRDRKQSGLFVAEGLRLFAEAPKDRVEKVILSESFARERQAKPFLRDYTCETVPDYLFESISETKSPQGILGIVRQFQYGTGDLMGNENRPFLLVLECIQDPGNLGTMFRAAEAAGVTGLILDRNTVDPYNPKVVRSTMGSIFRLPFVTVEDLEPCIREMKERGIAFYAAHLAGCMSYDEADYRGGCGFMIGNEANGLKDATADLADCRIRIPMAGRVESLNAAMAATVLMFEASRQRRY